MRRGKCRSCTMAALPCRRRCRCGFFVGFGILDFCVFCSDFDGLETTSHKSTNEEDCEGEKGLIVHKYVTPEGETVIKKYIKKEFLGKGGFAQCFRFHDLQTDTDVAGKIIDKNSLCKSRTFKKLLYEISIHKSLDHPNIVKFIDFFEDSKNVYIVLELCDDGNLNDFFKNTGKRERSLTESQIRNYVRQLVRALKFCHDRSIIHRDLKLGNLLLKDKKKTILLADFGLSARLEYPKQRRRTICGTPNYIAPEIIGSKTTHSFEVDVWSLGIIIYILIFGHAPFSSKNIKETYRKIKTVDFKIPAHKMVSSSLANLLQVMLEKDSSKRATLDELSVHPFTTEDGKLLPALEEETSDPKLPLSSVRKEEKAGIESNHFLKQSRVWVTKCSDFSSKYGMGYLLSNGNIGVFFNDKTKMLLSFQDLTYYEDTNEFHSYSLHKIPSRLKKKYRIVENFKSFLTKDEIEEQKEKGAIDPGTFIKAWMKSRNAIIFKFARKSVQVIFNDGTEVRMINKPSKMIEYVDPDGSCKLLELDQALESSDEELLKRLEYSRKMTKELSKR
ncbi:unnamed protein product [Moneuplotes crassus]|uniref:Serine/threonine-protein kinase PLK n=1 Tax=Euplotes crassus TaxID=5936 RepID=A0AAD1U9J8_EUPCR|nr:unnamed protein product [Moneuplotes crassus]